MKKISLLPIFLLIVLLVSLLAPQALALDAPELSSTAGILVDQDSGRVLFEKNADQTAYPASLTKVMTVLVAVEAVERGEFALTDSVTASDSCLQGMVDDGSTAGIVPGETMSLKDLLYCALLASANEACNVIGEYIGGTVSDFVDMMNSRAAGLGCSGTHFANTHGLPDESHYTTARDMALIYREALSHELFAEIAGTINYTVPATNVAGERQLSNTNGLINQNTQLYSGNYYEYAKTDKTGHTSAAGYCLVSSAEKEEIRLIAVVLGGQATQNSSGGYDYANFIDSRTLYDWGFENFSIREILSSSELITEVEVAMAEDDGKATLRPNSVITALVANDFDVSTLQRDIVVYSERDGEVLEAPIAAGTVLGEITLSLDGEVYGSTQLIAGSAVELSKVQYMKNQIAGVFELTWVKIVIVALVLALISYIALVIRYRVLHKRHMRELRRARLERQRRMEAENATRVFTEQPPASAPRQREAVTASAPRPRQPQQPPRQQTQQQTQPRTQTDEEKLRAQEKARRDYFEEFFKNKD